MRSTGPARTLILLRHAEAGGPGGIRDHDRPLADRGELDAAAAGTWLRENQPAVDAVLCSTALRTRQTLAASGVRATVRYAEEIYEASPGEVLDEIRRTPDTVHTLLVIGHAPGMPGLATRLAGRATDPHAAHALTSHFPPAGMAVLAVDSWATLGPGDATLTAFQVARA